MKNVNLLILGIVCLVAVTSCGKDKDPVIDNSNRDLKNIPIAELKTILAGNWLLKKKKDCGVAGCFPTTYPAG